MIRHRTLLGTSLLGTALLSAALLSITVFLIAPAAAETIEHRGVSFRIYRFDPATEDLELHLAGENKPGKFTEVAEKVRSDGKKLKFAMNSGIFEKNFIPTGLHISNGKTIVPLNREDFVKEQEGQFTPNFYLKPNGVFLFYESGSASIMETVSFAFTKTAKPDIAVQSGPLLVSQGEIHPALNKGSESTHYRNGVGVTKSGDVVFACSAIDPETGLTNLFTFADLFLNQLECPDALYLDGAISDIFIEGETDEIRNRNLFAGIFTITDK